MQQARYFYTDLHVNANGILFLKYLRYSVIITLVVATLHYVNAIKIHLIIHNNYINTL